MTKTYPPFKETYCVTPLPRCQVPALPPPGNECPQPTPQMVCRVGTAGDVCQPLPRRPE